MAGFEFTTEENEVIDVISVKDEWSRDVLERRIRHAIQDGLSFRRAVAKVLVQAERPDDKPEEPDTKSLITLVEEKKMAAAKRLAEKRGLRV